MRTEQEIKERFEYLKQQIEQECISYAEIAELQSLSAFIPESETLLQEWAETQY